MTYEELKQFKEQELADVWITRVKKLPIQSACDLEKFSMLCRLINTNTHQISAELYSKIQYLLET